MNNIERRDAGLPYISDETVMEEQKLTRRKLNTFNKTDIFEFDSLGEQLKELIHTEGSAFVNPPFHCDYGTHIYVGDNFYANYNCMIIDVAKVTIGKNVMFGPNVAVYTAGHPIHPAARNTQYEYGIPVTIGDNVWIGGNTVVNPGVTIGDNVVIGAGSVVTKDIPANTVAVGNPCRVIKEITEEDKQYYYKKQKFDPEAWEIVKDAQI